MSTKTYKYSIFWYETKERFNYDFHRITSAVYCFNKKIEWGIGFLYFSPPITWDEAQKCMNKQGGWNKIKPYKKNYSKKEWKRLIRVCRKTSRQMKVQYFHHYKMIRNPPDIHQIFHLSHEDVWPDRTLFLH